MQGSHELIECCSVNNKDTPLLRHNNKETSLLRHNTENEGESDGTTYAHMQVNFHTILFHKLSYIVAYFNEKRMLGLLRV